MQITNVFIWAQFADDSGRFVYKGVIPTADEVIVRQINYSSSDAVKGVCAIYFNLNNDVIGLCSNTEGFVCNPQTRIPLRNCPTHLEFQLFAPTPEEPRRPKGHVGDFIAISLDFIQN